MPFFSFKGYSPKVHGDAMISSLATIIGNVEICEGVSVFPGTVIRGDMAKIVVGKFSNIQDNVVLHGGDIDDGDILKKHLAVSIGDYVTVGHGAVIHSSVVEDVCLVGIRSVIYGSRIGEGSIVGMNSLVTKNMVIPKRSMVVGTPAKILKSVNNLTYSKLKKHAIDYYHLAKSHKGTLF